MPKDLKYQCPLCEVWFAAKHEYIPHYRKYHSDESDVDVLRAEIEKLTKERDKYDMALEEIGNLDGGYSAEDTKYFQAHQFHKAQKIARDAIALKE